MPASIGKNNAVNPRANRDLANLIENRSWKSWSEVLDESNQVRVKVKNLEGDFPRPSSHAPDRGVIQHYYHLDADDKRPMTTVLSKGSPTPPNSAPTDSSRTSSANESARKIPAYKGASNMVDTLGTPDENFDGTVPNTVDANKKTWTKDNGAAQSKTAQVSHPFKQGSTTAESFVEIPKDGKINSYEIELSENNIVPTWELTFSKNESELPNAIEPLGFALVQWFSRKPGGSPIETKAGTPFVAHVPVHTSAVSYKVSQVYDKRDRQNRTDFNKVSDSDVLFPLATKSHFLNWAVVPADLVPRICSVSYGGLSTTTSPRAPNSQELLAFDPVVDLGAKNGTPTILYTQRGNSTRLSRERYLELFNISVERFDPNTGAALPPDFSSAPDMIPFIGEEWDGTYPAHVKAGVGIIEPLGFALVSDPLWYSPGSKARGGWMYQEMPTDGTIQSWPIQLSNEIVHPFLFSDFTGRVNNWQVFQNDLNLTVVMWFSSTPGGTAHPRKGGSAAVLDLSLSTELRVRWNQVFSKDEEREAFENNAIRKRQWLDDAILFPFIQKTYFINFAVVTKDTAQSIVNVRAPTVEELEPFDPSISAYDSWIVSSPGGNVRDPNSSVYTAATVEEYLERFNINPDAIGGNFISPDILINPNSNQILPTSFSSHSNLIPYIGEEWDGVVPSYVELPAQMWYKLQTFAPEDNQPQNLFNQQKLNLRIPKDGKIHSYPIPAESTSIFGASIIGWQPAQTNGTVTPGFFRKDFNSKLNDSLVVVFWFSAIPGGESLKTEDGETLIVAKGLNAPEGPLPGIQQVYNLDEARSVSSNVVIPLIDKTYYWNVAVVEEGVFLTELSITGTDDGTGRCSRPPLPEELVAFDPIALSTFPDGTRSIENPVMTLNPDHYIPGVKRQAVSEFLLTNQYGANVLLFHDYVNLLNISIEEDSIDESRTSR